MKYFLLLLALHFFNLNSILARTADQRKDSLNEQALIHCSSISFEGGCFVTADDSHTNNDYGFLIGAEYLYEFPNRIGLGIKYNGLNSSDLFVASPGNHTMIAFLGPILSVPPFIKIGTKHSVVFSLGPGYYFYKNESDTPEYQCITTGDSIGYYLDGRYKYRISNLFSAFASISTLRSYIYDVVIKENGTTNKVSLRENDSIIEVATFSITLGLSFSF